MFKKLFSFVIILFIISVPTLASAEEKVLLIGDSLAVGLSPHLRKLAKNDNNPSVNGSLLPNKVRQYVSDSRGGTRLDQWLQHGWAKATLKRHKPTLILVSLGTNDAFKKDTWGERARMLVDLAHANNSKIVWIIPPPMPFNRNFVWEGAVNSGADGIFDSRCLNLRRHPDKVHVGDNERWAKEIWKFIRTGEQKCQN